MSTYYAHFNEELMGAGIQPGELAIYTGTVRDGIRSGPSTGDSSNAYVYCWQGEDVQDLDVRFQDGILEVSAHEDHYVFLRNGSGNFLQQVSGPAKPVVIGNIGADAIRVNTPLGKFLVPAGAMLRLDRGAPLQREKKKILLTFSDDTRRESSLKSALILEGERWRPLNICAKYQMAVVKDGAFTVQTLAMEGSTLKDPPCDSDYEVYLRTADNCSVVHFDGIGMMDEGLTRVERDFVLHEDVIYDFQRLRQAPTIKLMRQCTVRLPGLEELDAGPGALCPKEGRAEGTPDESPRFRQLPDSGADSSDFR